MKTDKRDIYTEVTDKIIQAIEAGTAPWQRPWRDVARTGAVRNAISGENYRGVNVLLLNIESHIKGYSDPRWCTYKQAQEKGWQVRKGEKSTPICFYSKIEKQGENIFGEQEKESYFLLKQFAVFNAAQIDGMPALADKPVVLNEIELDATAEKILKNSGANIIHSDINRAYYSPSEDHIKLPQVNAFNSTTEYYGTALHELGHWTGHSTRLDRDLTGSFGAESYAKEELRAELASAFLSAELGLPGSFDNHASYVQSWLKVLKNDKREIFKASADAQKIATYVKDLAGVELNIQPENDQIKTVKKQNADELKSELANNIEQKK